MYGRRVKQEKTTNNLLEEVGEQRLNMKKRCNNVTRVTESNKGHNIEESHHYPRPERTRHVNEEYDNNKSDAGNT